MSAAEVRRSAQGREPSPFGVERTLEVSLLFTSTRGSAKW